MNPLRYLSGESAQVGDIVTFGRQKGEVTIVGDDLLEWGLTQKQIAEGRIMIKFENGSLLCTDPAIEDLTLITPAG